MTRERMLLGNPPAQSGEATFPGGRMPLTPFHPGQAAHSPAARTLILLGLLLALAMLLAVPVAGL